MKDWKEQASKVPIPEPIVKAYTDYVDALDKYVKARKEHAPDFPFKKNDLVWYKRWENDEKWERGIIDLIKYKAYERSSFDCIGLWAIVVHPCKKDWTRAKRRHAFYLNDRSELKTKAAMIEKNL